MSVPFYTEWTSFPLRRNRQSFIGAFFLLNGAVMVLWGLAYLLDLPFLLSKVSYYGCAVFYFIFLLHLTAQRLNDMNLTAWLSLLWVSVWIISFSDYYISAALYFAYALILCTVEGTAGDNEYGRDPLVFTAE